MKHARVFFNQDEERWYWRATDDEQFQSSGTLHGPFLTGVDAGIDARNWITWTATEGPLHLPPAETLQ